MVRSTQQCGKARRLRKHLAETEEFVIRTGSPIAIATSVTHSTTLQDGDEPVTARLRCADKPARQINHSRSCVAVLAGGSGSALAQRLHLLETLGGISHDRRDAKDLAGQIVERGDRELDRDA